MVLGAGGVGKSCLTVQFVQGVYMDTYDPTIEDSYNKEIEVDGRLCNLEILDTAGVAQFTAMRELYIKNGQGFLLVYSVTDRNSMQELFAIKEQIARIKGTSNVPLVLVGNKCDLVNERQLTEEDGVEVSTKWNKVPFYETSAANRISVDEVFIDVVRQIIRKEIQQQQQVEQEEIQTHKISRTATGDLNINQPQQQQQQQQQKQQNSQQNSTPTNTQANGKNNSTNSKSNSAPNANPVSKKKKNKKKCVIL